MAVASTAIRRQRAAVQLLHRPPGYGAVDVVRTLLAVQAQDLRAAKLALRARGELFNAADVDAELSDRRTLVRGWLGRGTLHIVAREDYWWLLALTARARYTMNLRRLREEGVSQDDAERALKIIESALAGEGPLSRAALAARIAKEGIRTEGQATAHLVLFATLRAVSMLGPVRHGNQLFVLARDWLGEPEPPDRDAALAELARRYLTAHGPASAQDLAAWIGLPLRDARAGLEAIASEVVEVGDDLFDLTANDPIPERACSAPSIPICWAGRTASSPSRRSTPAPCTRAAASSARSRPSTAWWSAPGAAATASTCSSQWTTRPPTPWRPRPRTSCASRASGPRARPACRRPSSSRPPRARPPRGRGRR